MKIKKIIIIILLGVFFTPSKIIAQEKNRISVQTGLFHYYFDKSPILNINHPGKNKPSPFNRLLINSLGLLYSRTLSSESYVSLEFNTFREGYDKHTSIYPYYGDPQIGFRFFETYNIGYTRIYKTKNKFNFVYGGGINHRRGEEIVIIAIIPMAVNGEYELYELLLENIRRKDYGLNVFSGVEYTPKKWLTFYSKVDLLSFIYIHDKENLNKFKNHYNSPQFPSRFDLSLRFGVGINF